MIITIAYWLAIISTTAFIVLWFWVARKELLEKQNMVESARCQLYASREAYTHAHDDLDKEQAQEILKRSQSVYRQATHIYNKTICKPWNAVPAFFFRFRKETE